MASAQPPTEPPTTEPTATPLPVANAAEARDVALGYVQVVYGVQPPPAGVEWQEEPTTDDELVGASGVRYRLGDWVVTVTYPVVAPEATIFHVFATELASGFQWEGEVDAGAAITEIVMVEEPDVFFEGVGFSYDDSIATGVDAERIPSTGPAGPDRAEWEVEPEHFIFSFNGYVLPDTFHEPRIAIYPAAELETASGVGARIMSAMRQALAARPEAAPPNSVMLTFNAGHLMSTPAVYLDFNGGSGMRYLTQMAQAYYPINNRDLFYAFQGLTDDGQWYVAAVLPVAHPSLPADAGEYTSGDQTAFTDDFETYAAEIAAQLEAEAPGSFTPDLSLLDAMMTSLRIEATAPEGGAEEGGQAVAAWGGFVEGQPSGAQFDDCLALQPEGAGEIGLSGVDSTVEAQIQVLRDSGTYAHFWGTLNCPAVDCGGCELVVRRIHEDRPGPFMEPDPVEAWEGKIVGLPAGAQFDDYFELAGDFPVGFGIDSTNAGIAAELDFLRDNGEAVRIWGTVEVNVPDAFGVHINVERLERLSLTDAAGAWTSYVNDGFDFSLQYPTNAALFEGTDGRSIQISGPLVDNERWPMIEVLYYDSEFYQPPEGQDLGLWVVDRVPAFDAIDPTQQVAGLPAVWVTTNASPQAYGVDEFYVAKDGQLFRIAFIHTKGQQDWDLYTRFLEGFSFTD
jgi:hypothetical protein